MIGQIGQTSVATSWSFPSPTSQVPNLYVKYPASYAEALASVDVPLADDTGSVIRTARGLLYDNRYRTVNVTNQLLCSCISPIYAQIGTAPVAFQPNSTYLFTATGRIINGFRNRDDQGVIGTTSRSAVMGGFITFTTLEYRTCVRSVTFYVSIFGTTPIVFGVFGTNDNLNFKRLSVIDLTLPKALYQQQAGFSYQDNQDQGDNSIQGYVENTLPFVVYDTNTAVPSFFYGAPARLNSDTKPTNPPRTFTFKNETCYSAYMLKHLPQNTADLTADSLDTFNFFVSEIEWG
jgi:hypothetical protein